MSCIATMKAQFENAHGMMIQFVETCPENVWAQTYGGFPVWQQAFHALACYDFFVRDDKSAPLATPFGEKTGDVIQFKDCPSVPSKEVITTFAAEAKKTADAFIDGLKDEDLGAKHAGLSSRLPFESNNLDVLAKLCSHTMYHLGGCDAALRGNGLPGIF